MFKNVPYKQRAVSVALVALLSGAGIYALTASAADGPSAAQNGMSMHHDYEKMREKRMADELSLTPQQQQLAQLAMQKMRPSRDAMEQMKKQHEARLLALMDPNFDPRKAAAAEDQEHAAMQAQHQDARQAWLALWDTLNADQRVKARLMLLKMAEGGGGHMGHHMHGWHGGEEWHGHEGGPDGGHGQDGMAPPPPAHG